MHPMASAMGRSSDTIVGDLPFVVTKRRGGATSYGWSPPRRDATILVLILHRASIRLSRADLYPFIGQEVVGRLDNVILSFSDIVGVG